MKKIIKTDQAPVAIGAYSQAVRAGDTVYISGQIPLQASTMEVVSGDFTEQAQQVFRNLAAVAEAADSSLADAVKLTCYLTDLNDFAALNEVMALQLTDPVTKLTGVGPQLAAKLERVHVHTVQDVLFHLPHRYEDKTTVTPIGALLPEMSSVVIGQIDLAQVVFGRRRSLLVKLSDGTGSLTIRMFHFNRSQEKSFQRGLWVRAFG